MDQNNFLAIFPGSKGVVKSDSSNAVRVLGIDLGTTNSTAAQIIWAPSSANQPVVECIDVKQPTTTGAYSSALVPSVVALYDGQIWIGEGAKRLRANTELKRNRNIFYECKNEMGTRRTYHMAPEGFRSPPEIGAKVLAFLKEAALKANNKDIARFVVTVPASFQISQRRDTLRAAELAGLHIRPGDLLDEPVAAFLDYCASHPLIANEEFTEKQNLLVFDFGGGTCDVAVFHIIHDRNNKRLKISPTAVSRYHRLGGGDIDAAIVHEVLIPQIIEQNRIDTHALDFEARKHYIEPALLSVAEALKVGLCLEIARLRAFKKYTNATKSSVEKTQPGSWPCPCPKHPSLTLTSPRLTAEEFEEILEPFFDTEFLYARETEYRLTCSIFAPISDVLDRSGLKPRDINLCLLVGGSSLIPQVQEAVQQFFKTARLLIYDNEESVQLSVARGAAYHALSLALYQEPLIQPISGDCIKICTESGPLELIPKGAVLPFPGQDQFIDFHELVVPKTSVTEPVPLRVELVTGDDNQPVFTAIWKISPPVNQGDQLRLSVSMDSNQYVNLKLILTKRPDDPPFECVIENPLTVVVNPDALRQKIDETEEQLRSGNVPGKQIADTLGDLANDYYELGQTDKAIFYLKQALRRKNKPDADLLNRLGIYYGEKGDWQNEEKAYLEAFQASPRNAAPLFNLALSQQRRKRFTEARATIEKALSIDPEPPYMTLHAMILKAQGHTVEAEAELKEALNDFDPLSFLSDWELGWYETTATLLGDHPGAQKAAEELKRRSSKKSSADVPAGYLPQIKTALRKI